MCADKGQLPIFYGLELHEVIGEGSYARVFRGRYHNETVAVKVVSQRQLDPFWWNYRLTEAAILRELGSHRNIVPVYEVREDEELTAIVMQLAGNGDLLDALNAHGPWTETEARDIFEQMLSAVLYAHAKGICHRGMPSRPTLIARIN